MTAPKLKQTFRIIALVAFAAACGIGWLIISSRAKAVLEAKHPRPASAVIASASPDAVAAGERLVRIAGCASCHGAELTGGSLGPVGGRIEAPNLIMAARKRSDAEMDLAIRRGLRPDLTSEFAMPSRVYAVFTDGEVGNVIAYLRSLAPKGELKPRPAPGPVLEVNIATGMLRPEADRITTSSPPLDAGAQAQAGRRLSGLFCGRCHWSDLGGGHGAAGPDITVRQYFDRAQFHELMKTGEGGPVSEMPLMQQAARSGLSRLTAPEVDAIYDYLMARDRILAAAPPGKARGKR
jgi:mono/diheme cytochrome c family protein